MSLASTTASTPLLEYFNARKQFYQFIRFLFWEPLSEQSFKEICENGNLAELAQMSKGGQLLQSFFEKKTPQLHEEQAEYQRLFVGPGPIEVPLWESVYRSKDHLLFEETTFQVRKLYHRFGLQYHKENNEPDDHLLIELEFLIYLIDSSLQELQIPHQCRTTPHSFEDVYEAQIEFLEQHLCKWVPKFCSKMLESTESLLYQGAALILTDFIMDDLFFLLETKEELSYESN
jgi:putative dimethyl sulfoxide reductase chaperone